MSNSVVMALWEEIYGDKTCKKTPDESINFCSCKRKQKVKRKKRNNNKSKKQRSKSKKKNKSLVKTKKNIFYSVLSHSGLQWTVAGLIAAAFSYYLLHITPSKGWWSGINIP